MSAFPLAWHEQNLRNAEHYLAQQEKIFEAQIKHITRVRESVVFQRKQIAQAIAQKKKSFDAEKFMKREREIIE